MIKLVQVLDENRSLLWNLLQKYLYEMTRFYGDEMDENGNYYYKYFDAYFIEPERKAFLMYVEEKLVGFAMINPYSYIDASVDYVLAEFTVFPMYRESGIGMRAAAQILETFTGRWELKYNRSNTSAKNLWKKVTARYNPAKHSFGENETVLSFVTE